MTKHAPFPIAILVLAVSLAAHGAEPDRYLEVDGIVVVEAERPVLPESLPVDWLVRDDLPDYTGDSFIEWNGPSHYPKSEAGDGTLTFPIRIVTPGVYEFRWRSRIARGEINTEHNDSWVRLPTGENVEGEYPIDGWTKSHMSVMDAWTWNTGTGDGIGANIRQHFDAGDHVIEISGRSPGHALDRIVLFNTAMKDFSSAAFDVEPVSTLLDGSTGGDVEPDPLDLVAPGECAGNTLVLEPVADLDSDGVTSSDDEALRVGNSRRAFLKFDLTDVPPLTGVSLRVTTLASNAAGQLGLWLGSGSAWDEGMDGSLPDSVAALAAIDGPFGDVERAVAVVDPTMVTGAALSIVLEASAGDTFELASRQAEDGRPRLVLEGDDRFCDDYADASSGSGTTTGDPGTDEGGSDGTGAADAGGTSGGAGDGGDDGGATSGVDGGANTSGDPGASSGGDSGSATAGDAGVATAGSDGSGGGEGSADGSDPGVTDTTAGGASGIGIVLLLIAGAARRRRSRVRVAPQ